MKISSFSYLQGMHLNMIINILLRLHFFHPLPCQTTPLSSKSPSPLPFLPPDQLFTAGRVEHFTTKQLIGAEHQADEGKGGGGDQQVSRGEVNLAARRCVTSQ